MGIMVLGGDGYLGWPSLMCRAGCPGPVEVEYPNNRWRETVNSRRW